MNEPKAAQLTLTPPVADGAEPGDFPAQWHRYKPLLDLCTHAELTSAVLLKDGACHNVFSVLTFTRQAPDYKPATPFEFLTRKPETVPATGYKVAVARSSVSAIDGLRTLRSAKQFVEPVKGRLVDCVGRWADPVFVDNQHRIRNVVPYVDARFWAFQKIPPADALVQLVGAKALSWLLQRVSHILGRSLTARAEYAGGFFVVLPEYRAKIRVDRGENGRIGVEFDGDRQAIRPVALARVSRNEEMCSATLQELGERFSVLEVGASDFEEVELYDLVSGLLVDRHAGIPNRGLGLTLHTVEPITFDVTLHDDSGVPVGEPVHVSTNWGRSLVTGVEGRAEWERDQRRSALLAEQRRLHTEGRLFFYSGSKSDRKKAINDIRGLIRMHGGVEVCVWDPYFGGRDALEFLPHVVDPATPVRVLTSLQRADGGAKHESVKAQLREALSAVALPRGKGPGMTNIQARVGTGFHDRFLITSASCWQLGSSFNQIGSSYSTIVEFPYRELVANAFEKEWNSASPFA